MSLLGDIKNVSGALGEVGKAGRLADLRAKTPILAGGQLAIGGMRLTTGFGDPEDGARFGEGGARFGEAGATLSSAYPHGAWSGAGSDAYSDANARQVSRTTATSAADRSVNGVLAREANQIVATRTALDDQSDWLADVGLVTMLVAATPCVGQGAALAMEIAAVTKALGVCTTQLVQLTQQVNSNAAEIQQTVKQYDGVTGLGTMSRRTTDPDIPKPAEDDGQKPGEKPGDESTDGEKPESGEETPVGGDGSGTAPGGASGGASGGGASGGGASGGGASESAAPCEAKTSPGHDVPTTDLPAAPTSPAAVPTGSVGGSAAPMGAAPAAAGALPAATAAGINAAQLASLVQSAVQQALNQSAQQKANEQARQADAEARKDSDRDGVPDVRDDSDEDGVSDAKDDDNGDGIPDIEQDADGDGRPDVTAGAAPGTPDGERAPVHPRVEADPEGLTTPIGTPITFALDRDDRSGSTTVA